MRNSITSRRRLEVERLDTRELMAAGVTAGLSHGVLSIVGTSAAAPIVVDVLATSTRHGVTGWVVVEGVGNFRASTVHKVVISGIAGELVLVRKAPRWNPVIQVNPPVIPHPVISAPVTLPIQTPPAHAWVESAAEQAIVNAVNQVRIANGLGALTVNPKLVEAAQFHAVDMAQFKTMAHDLPGSLLPGLADRAAFVGYNYSTLGENIAVGYADTAPVMNAWMNSPGHRANILGADYTEIGVGIAVDSNGVPYYCQVFGHQMGG
jgi:uncharacterized protein YkwD